MRLESRCLVLLEVGLFLKEFWGNFSFTTNFILFYKVILKYNYFHKYLKFVIKNRLNQ